MPENELNQWKQISEQIKLFCEDRDWDRFHNPKDLAIGVSTEAAELLELFRFMTPDQVEKSMANLEFRQKVADEIADVLFFLIRIAQMNSFELPQVLVEKMKKNALRYPADKFRGSNRKYDE